MFHKMKKKILETQDYFNHPLCAMSTCVVVCVVLTYLYYNTIFNILLCTTTYFNYVYVRDIFIHMIR